MGIDLSDGMLEQARRKAEAAGQENIEFRHGDAERLEFPDAGTDPGTDPLSDEWIPTAEAARRKGVTFSGLDQAIARGEVLARPAKPGGARRLVSVRSLDRWEPSASRQAAGKASRSRRKGSAA